MTESQSPNVPKPKMILSMTGESSPWRCTLSPTQLCVRFVLSVPLSSHCASVQSSATQNLFDALRFQSLYLNLRLHVTSTLQQFVTMDWPLFHYLSSHVFPKMSCLFSFATTSPFERKPDQT